MGAHGRQHALRMLAVLALLASAAFPIYWMLVTSLTPSADLFAARPRFLPTLDQIGVYKEVFSTIPVTTWLANSAIVATGTMALSIALAILPAYALSRFRFRGKGLLGFALFVTQMLPEAMNASRSSKGPPASPRFQFETGLMLVERTYL